MPFRCIYYLNMILAHLTDRLSLCRWRTVRPREILRQAEKINSQRATINLINYGATAWCECKRIKVSPSVLLSLSYFPFTPIYCLLDVHV